MRACAIHAPTIVRRMRLIFLLSLLALQTVLVSTLTSSDPGQSRATDGDNGRTHKVMFKFTYDGDATTCQYKIPHFGLVKISVPRFMRQYSGDRIAEELNYYLLSNQRWSQRVILELLYYGLVYGADYKPPEEIEHPCLRDATNWLNDTVDVCDWEGITCGSVLPSKRQRPRIELKLDIPIDEPHSWGPTEEYRRAAPNVITMIDLPKMACPGTLPEELYMLSELRRLDFRNNCLRGTIPTTFGDMAKLDFLDLSFNQLTGVPVQLSKLSKNLQELWLGNNMLQGPIYPYLAKMRKLRVLDVSDNKLTGTIPSDLHHFVQLAGFFFENNVIRGTIPSEIGTALTGLQYFYAKNNILGGTIPTELGLLSNLVLLVLEYNLFEGTFPTELGKLELLEGLNIADNALSGTIPATDDLDGGVQWSNMGHLSRFDIHGNKFTGTFPASLIVGLSNTLTYLDIGFNSLTGTLPSELGEASKLLEFDTPLNSFVGTIPNELGRLFGLQRMNLTSNHFHGTIPIVLCDGSKHRHVPLYGCDAILCPAGTFHPNGAADNYGACRVCEQSLLDGVAPASNYLGQTTCEGGSFFIGDANGDGIQSPREILQFMYRENSGFYWGAKFSDWLDTSIPDCELPGITCSGSEISQIDLSDADVCSDVNGEEGPPDECEGIPAEISLLSNLEVISMPQRSFLQGSIPTEIGLLSKLRLLDLSYCPLLRGTIPTEIGKLLNLKKLNLKNCHFSGTIPSELFSLPRLEKLHIGDKNRLTGSIPEAIGKATRLIEIFAGDLSLTTTIPTTIGQLTVLQNVDFHASNVSGTIPLELGNCTALLGLHMSNNRLTGTIPSTLAQMEGLQVFHLKNNELTGRLPEEIGNLHYLTWIDASFNILSGTIPSSYGRIRTLKDVRLGGNRLHDPIPQALCASVQINGGRTRSFGCDGILCPLGYYHDEGFADDSNDSCTKCPNGKTTIYLGSVECVELHVEDLLSMLHDVMGGKMWDQNDVFRWNTEVNICHW